LLIAILAQFLASFAFKAETIVAYPFAARGAQVEFHAGVKVCLFKRRLVFLRPKQFPRFIMLNVGKVPIIELYGFAPPFLAAAVAKETERKRVRSGMINRFLR